MFWFFKKLLKWTQNIPQWSWVSWILSQNVTLAYLIIYLKLFHCFYFSTLWELEGSQWFSNWRVVIPGVNTEPLQRGCLWPGVKSIVKLRWVNKTDGEINKSLQMQAFVKILLGLFCIGCFSCHCERLWFLCNTGLKQLSTFSEVLSVAAEHCHLEVHSSMCTSTDRKTETVVTPCQVFSTVM